MISILCVWGCTLLTPAPMTMVTCSPWYELRQGSGQVRSCDSFPKGTKHAEWVRAIDGVWRLYYR